LPFTGLSDANGFLTIPQIPADQSFTAVAIDTMTGAMRSTGGVGGPVDAVVTMLFDFTSDAESPAVVGFGSNVSGTLSEMETHIYALEAEAGPAARFGLFTPAPNAWSDPDVILTVTTPSGQVLGTTANRAQYPHFKTVLEQELSETGTYLVLVASTSTEPRASSSSRASTSSTTSNGTRSSSRHSVQSRSCSATRLTPISTPRSSCAAPMDRRPARSPEAPRAQSARS
jgi:hypothetical protein